MPARPLCYGQCAGNRRLAARYDLPLSARPRGRRVVAGSVPTDDGWRMLDQYPSQYVSRERSVCCVCCLRTDQHGAVRLLSRECNDSSVRANEGADYDIRNQRIQRTQCTTTFTLHVSA